MTTVAPLAFNGNVLPQQPPHPVTFAPLIPVFQRILADVDLVRALKPAVECMDSGPFLNVSLVSLKSVPYAFFPNAPVVKQLEDGLSCRLRYLEAAVMATAGFVYNLVFASIFSVLSLVTFGQIKMCTIQMRKFCMQTAAAGLAVGVGLAGTVSPKWGVKVNFAAGLAFGAFVLHTAQSGVVRSLCTVYQRHRSELRTAGLDCVQRDAAFFNREFVPLLNYLDANLNNRVESFVDLFTVMQGARQHLPNINAFGFPGSILDSVLQGVSRLFSGDQNGSP